MKKCTQSILLVFAYSTMALCADELFTVIKIAPSLGIYPRTGFEDVRGKTQDGKLSGFDGLLNGGTIASIGIATDVLSLAIESSYSGVLSPKDKLTYENDEIIKAGFYRFTSSIVTTYKIINKEKVSIYLYNGGRFQRLESNLTLKNSISNIETSYIDGHHIYNNIFTGPSIDFKIHKKNSIILSYYRYIGFNPTDFYCIEYSFLHPKSDNNLSKACVFMSIEKSRGFSNIFMGLSVSAARNID
jgi:hypothetical protein